MEKITNTFTLNIEYDIQKGISEDALKPVGYLVQKYPNANITINLKFSK